MCIHALGGQARVASVHGISKLVKSNQSIKAPGIHISSLIIKGAWIIGGLVGTLSRIKKTSNVHPEQAHIVHLHGWHEMFFSYSVSFSAHYLPGATLWGCWRGSLCSSRQRTSDISLPYNPQLLTAYVRFYATVSNLPISQTGFGQCQYVEPLR